MPIQASKKKTLLSIEAGWVEISWCLPGLRNNSVTDFENPLKRPVKLLKYSQHESGNIANIYILSVTAKYGLFLVSRTALSCKY